MRKIKEAGINASFQNSNIRIVDFARTQFEKRLDSNDYEWLASVRDRIGKHHEALSFQVESYVGDWSALLIYRRDDDRYIWNPLKEWHPDALSQEGRFANLLPPPCGPGVPRA